MSIPFLILCPKKLPDLLRFLDLDLLPCIFIYLTLLFSVPKSLLQPYVPKNFVTSSNFWLLTYLYLSVVPVFLLLLIKPYFSVLTCPSPFQFSIPKKFLTSSGFRI